MPINSVAPFLLYGLNDSVTLLLPFQVVNLLAKSFKFILKEPFGVIFLNNGILVTPSFANNSTSIDASILKEFSLFFNEI